MNGATSRLDYLQKKYIYILLYGFIGAVCHGNVKNGMFPEKIPLNNFDE